MHWAFKHYEMKTYISLPLTSAVYPEPKAALISLINLVVSLWLVDWADKMCCYSEPRRSLFHDIKPLFAGCLHPERSGPVSAGGQEEGKYIQECNAWLGTAVGHQPSFLQCRSLLCSLVVPPFLHEVTIFRNIQGYIVKKCLLSSHHFPKHFCEKRWHTNIDRTPFQDWTIRLFSTTAKSLRLFNLLLLLFGQCLQCLCICWFIQKNKLWDPFSLYVIATHLSIMSRAQTALRIEAHLGTERAIKWVPAGVLVVMLQSARQCSTQPCRAWLPLKPILWKCIFVMEGIWIYEYLLMTLLWQSQTDGAAGRGMGGKKGRKPERMAW